MAVPLPITSIMEWTRGDVVCKPTEGNRSQLSVDYEDIGSSDRMANARLRKYHVARKRSWSVSWTMVPAPTSETVDGNAGGAEMEQFYHDTPVEFTMSIKHKDTGLDETVQVVFTSFSKVHVARGAFDMWDVSISVEEC